MAPEVNEGASVIKHLKKVCNTETGKEIRGSLIGWHVQQSATLLSIRSLPYKAEYQPVNC
jgi:hypothetical protein